MNQSNFAKWHIKGRNSSLHNF
ncbi:hypothetical protein RIR_e4655_jg27268.t1 [Rhizophagus irregularis DAOM 181602=DAOM 197198]|nr:hypothetical protein RIR_e4655_jg27268.t1 [Rhizophagus irregularis DAOM 181602=DAOM 197198]